MEQENEFVRERIDAYVKFLDGIVGKVKSEAVALGLLQECARDRRMEEIRRERDRSNGDAATERQIAFLRDLGVEIEPGLTKRQASQLIDEARAVER